MIQNCTSGVRSPTHILVSAWGIICKIFSTSINNIRSSCSSSTQDQPHKIKKGLNSQYSRFIPRLAAVLCYYGSAWNERVGQSWGWSYPQVWKLLGWFTSHRSVQVQVWCAWVIIPVHGNDGGLVGVKVDETVAGGLTRELVRHHLEGEGKVSKKMMRKYAFQEPLLE